MPRDQAAPWEPAASREPGPISQQRHWATPDYLAAAACAAARITPAPFFWAPPTWVLGLLQAPGRPPAGGRRERRL